MPKITVSSTSHHLIDIDAIANFEDNIKIGKRKYSRKNTVYVKPISFNVHGEAWHKFYELAQHIEGDCDSELCIHCKESRD